MDILSDYQQFEENIKGSRFLSELFPCETQNQAREILKEQKTKYSDATHVVHAFITGPGAEVMGMSDDGEPSGTAGRPTLDVLKGSNCTNLMITITRWFGGALLGTGGLVKAYSNGAKQVIESARNNNLIQPLIEKKEFLFTADYNLYKLIKIKLGQYTISDVHEDFGTEITISGKIKQDEYSALALQLKEISNGKIIIK